jgi:ribosomal protein S3
MGQKVNPIGFRLGVNRDWRSRWYASEQEFPSFLHSDLKIRNYVKKKLQFAAVSKIVIERAWNSIRVTIHTARPGIVIGRKGAEIEKMTEEISKMAEGKQVKIDIQEIKTPELDAQLVAENVALQIERRIAYRRAMKKPCRWRWILARKGFVFAVRVGSMALRSRARNGIGREKFRCTHCARRSITVSRKQTRFMERSALNFGFVKR